MKKLCLLLILFSFTASSNNTDTSNTTNNDLITTNTNEILNDSRIGKQYIPIKKTKEDNVFSYSFIDKNSVALHPYNKKIRVFAEIINFAPEQVSKDNNSPKQTYRSLKVMQYANCDRKEIAKGTIQIFEKYFADGKLIDSSDTPHRWVDAKPKNEDHQFIIIACSLPLADQQKTD